VLGKSGEFYFVSFIYFLELKVKPVFCVAVKPGARKYVDLLNDVSTGNYERVVTCDIAKCFFNLIELTDVENLSLLDAAVLTAVRRCVSAAVDDEETVLKSVVFC